MKEFDIFEIADEHGLQIIETTTDGTGYPKNLKKALIGFDSYEDAKKLADEYGLRITTFTTHTGWQLWVREKSTTFSALTISAESYGDDFRAYTCGDAADFFENEVKPMLGDFVNFDDLENFIIEQKRILEEIEYVDDEKLVIVNGWRYYDTVKRTTMDWSHDNKHYEVGVIKD